jgi:hypothetical protein
MIACPDWADARSVAVVNLELPWMATWGLIFFSLGFLLQLLAIPNARTIAQLRQDIKKARMEIKAKEIAARVRTD